MLIPPAAIQNVNHSSCSAYQRWSLKSVAVQPNYLQVKGTGVRLYHASSNVKVRSAFSLCYTSHKALPPTVRNKAYLQQCKLCNDNCNL